METLFFPEPHPVSAGTLNAAASSNAVIFRHFPMSAKPCRQPVFFRFCCFFSGSCRILQTSFVLIHITSICFLWFILYYSHRNLSIPKIDFGGFTKIPTNPVCIMYISQKIETISPLFFIVRLAYLNLIIILEVIFSPHSFKPFEPPV